MRWKIHSLSRTDNFFPEFCRQPSCWIASRFRDAARFLLFIIIIIIYFIVLWEASLSLNCPWKSCKGLLSTKMWKAAALFSIWHFIALVVASKLCFLFRHENKQRILIYHLYSTQGFTDPPSHPPLTACYPGSYAPTRKPVHTFLP